MMLHGQSNKLHRDKPDTVFKIGSSTILNFIGERYENTTVQQAKRKIIAIPPQEPKRLVRGGDGPGPGVTPGCLHRYSLQPIPLQPAVKVQTMVER